MSAIVNVYETLDQFSKTRQLLAILPGGVENALLPAEIGARMRSESGEVLSKASVRAVMRNLQRLESRLLDSGAISRRVLGKTFERYDIENAGRYYLEELDRQELDAHLRETPQHESPARADTSSRAEFGRTRIAERVVLIRIPQLHRAGMSEDDLYEATRKWWRMSPDRHEPDWAFTVVHGVVKAVYRIREWEQEFGGRWRSTGRAIPSWKTGTWKSMSANTCLAERRTPSGT